MARLNVQAAARWAGAGPDQILAGQPTFQLIPMLVALSVTDENGVGVQDLVESEVRVGYQDQVEAVEGTLTSISHFHHNGPTVGGAGWYSCIVTSAGPSGWLQDEVFLCVTVRHGPDRGQTILLARYHQFH